MEGLSHEKLENAQEVLHQKSVGASRCSSVAHVLQPATQVIFVYSAPLVIGDPKS